MTENEKKLIYPILLGTGSLILFRAAANRIFQADTKTQKVKKLPSFEIPDDQTSSRNKKNVSPKAIIEYKYKTAGGYDIYNYSTDLNTDEINRVYCPELLGSNDLEALIFSKTAPYLGLASDLKMEPPRWAMAGTGLDMSFAIRTKRDNKNLIARYLKRKNTEAVITESEKKLLMDLLDLVEKSLRLYESECSFDAKGKKVSESVSVLDVQRILAGALWTVVQDSASRSYLKFSQCILELIQKLIENNEKLKEPQKNTGKYKSFVDCFADGWFNCETPGASKLYVISNPSMVLFRNMIPSKAITVGGLPISFPPEFEPVFLSGVVFYADSF